MKITLLNLKIRRPLGLEMKNGGQEQNRTADTGIFSCDFKP